MSSCVDTSEGFDTDAVIVDTCGTTDARDKAVDVDDVVGSIKSDNSVDIDDRGGICDGDVDSSTREVDKMDVPLYVVTPISLS